LYVVRSYPPPDAHLKEQFMLYPPKKPFRFVQSLIVALAPATPALAVVTTWTDGANNGLWNDPGNWSSGTPTATDVATIPIGGTLTLSATPPATVSGLLRSTMSAVTLSGGRLLADQINGGFGAPFIINSDLSPNGNSLIVLLSTVGGTIGDGSGGGNFDVTLSTAVLRNVATHTGSTALASATLTLGGAVASSSGVTVSGDSAILADPTNFPMVNRLPDAGPLQLNGANFTFDGGATGTTAESTGTLALRATNSLKLLGPASGSLVLTSAALTHETSTVLNLVTSPTARLRFVQSPTAPAGPSPTERDVIGFGVGTVSDGAGARYTFLTYDKGADGNDINDDPGLRPLAWDGEHATTLAGATSATDVRLSGTQLLAGGSTTVRSLNIADGSLQLNGARLEIDRGLIVQGAAVPSGVGGQGTLHFNGDASIHAIGAGGGQAHTLAVPIEADSLTKAGDGELVLSSPNAIGGAVYVAGGTLTSRAAGALGAGTVILTGGALRAEVASQTLQRLTTTASTNVSTGPGVVLEVKRLNVPSILSFGGSGTVRLPVDAEASAVLQVQGGTLQVDGQLLSPTPFGDVTISGGAVGGSGTISGTVRASGLGAATISPGTDGGAGRLTVGTVALGSTVFQGVPLLDLDLNGTSPGADYDQLRVLNGTTLSRFALDVSVGFPAQFGDSFTIIDDVFSGPILGAHASLPEGATISSGGYQFRLSYLGGDGNDVTLTVVPEPTSMTLTAAAVGITSRRRRRIGRVAQSRRVA
jgi:fibronectin-binding autotransporter adhesin